MSKRIKCGTRPLGEDRDLALQVGDVVLARRIEEAEVRRQGVAVSVRLAHWL